MLNNFSNSLHHNFGFDPDTFFAAEENIDLAYPTWRFYDNLKENKKVEVGGV